MFGAPTREALLNEFRNAKMKFIPDFYSGGLLVNNSSEIMSEFETYYKELFSAFSENDNECLVRQFLPFVTPLTNEECELVRGSFTIQEINFLLNSCHCPKHQDLIKYPANFTKHLNSYCVLYCSTFSG